MEKLEKTFRLLETLLTASDVCMKMRIALIYEPRQMLDNHRNKHINSIICI